MEINDRLNKLREFINKVKTNKRIIICIEGRCASGKTTITNMLSKVTIIHADDHFNIKPIDFDYLYNLLNNLNGDEFIERIYDCHKDSYYDVTKKLYNVVIIEGVYSFSNKLKGLYDYLVYFDVDKDTQYKRINERENKEAYFNKWIPNEEKYYESNNIKEEADIII